MAHCVPGRLNQKYAPATYTCFADLKMLASTPACDDSWTRRMPDLEDAAARSPLPSARRGGYRASLVRRAGTVGNEAPVPGAGKPGVLRARPGSRSRHGDRLRVIANIAQGLEAGRI